VAVLVDIRVLGVLVEILEMLELRVLAVIPQRVLMLSYLVVQVARQLPHLQTPPAMLAAYPVRAAAVVFAILLVRQTKAGAAVAVAAQATQGSRLSWDHPQQALCLPLRLALAAQVR
jgi:hypothetical protein